MASLGFALDSSRLSIALWWRLGTGGLRRLMRALVLDFYWLGIYMMSMRGLEILLCLSCHLRRRMWRRCRVGLGCSRA